MTDNIELRSRYKWLIELLAQHFPTPPDPDPQWLRGVIAALADRPPPTPWLQGGPPPQPWRQPLNLPVQGGPPPTPWRQGFDMSAMVAEAVLSAVRLKVVAEKAGKDEAKGRADARLREIITGWCGNEPIIIVFPSPPVPPDDPEWFADPQRRREGLISNLMAASDMMRAGPVADAAQGLAVQVMQEFG
ncbi:MAG: hypothetical protein ACRC6I_17500 [Paracoccaceae bacterium]